RVDHRSFEAQGIGLDPQNKIGAAAQRTAERGLESERVEDHHAIARGNGEKIIAEPRLAIDAITRQQATFTRRDLAMFVHRHSDGVEQFERAVGAVQASPDLVALGADGRGEERFTSREMIEAEQRLLRAAEAMAERERHHAGEHDQAEALARAVERGLTLSGEQSAAFEHVVQGPDLAVVVGYAGSGKSAMLGVAREAWDASGLEVRGLALSGIAAENLQNGSGIASRTIASLEHQWDQGREFLTASDVLVIDEAGMVGTRQLERVLSAAHDAGAKLVLVGDPQQLQAIEAGAAFRALHERHGGVEITEIRRQGGDWQRVATRHLATGRTAEALDAYAEHGAVHAAETREQARGDLVDRWDRDRLAEPDRSRIILTHTNTEARELNEAARERMRQAGALGEDVAIMTERGGRDFAAGDRVMFLRNERSLAVKNGMLGTVEAVTPDRMTVRLDGGQGVAFDLKGYAHVDHGYVASIHKAQGMTVDRTHVLATPGLDQHGTYVALSRHRERVDLHYGRDDFADPGSLGRVLARERAKDMASDYEPAQAFAERRGIGARIADRVVEIVRKAPEAIRGMFDGLDLGHAPARTPGRAGSAFDGLKLEAVPSRNTQADRERLRGLAAGRHARAVSAVWTMEDKDLPVLPHQQKELERARDGLGRQAAKDLERVYGKDPAAAVEAAAGRPRRALRAMQLEAEIRTNPALRADRFVESWQRLDREHRSTFAAGHHAGAQQARASMGAMAKGLERDAQVESLLRGRRAELGIALDMGRGVAGDLAMSIGVQIGRNLGIGL
ncbi:MAG: Ti-type conjugative transfer relaxase TraA, partial [Caulobacteraceae bacterium]